MAGALPVAPMVLRVGQSSDQRLLQFECRGETPAASASNETRLSARFRAWVSTHPSRPARLALLRRLDRATQFGWCVFAASTLLALTLLMLACRRRPTDTERFGSLPYRFVEMRVEGPLVTPLGARERRLVWVILVACATSSAVTGRRQRVLDEQHLLRSTPPAAGTSAPAFPTSLWCDCERGRECDCFLPRGECQHHCAGGCTVDRDVSVAPLRYAPGEGALRDVSEVTWAAVITTPPCGNRYGSTAMSRPKICRRVTHPLMPPRLLPICSRSP